MYAKGLIWIRRYNLRIAREKEKWTERLACVRSRLDCRNGGDFLEVVGNSFELDGMNNIFQGLINSSLKEPKKIFLYDGVGALISAFFLGVVLVYFQEHIGIPKNTLYLLASFPILFFVYDVVCFFIVEKKMSIAIYILAIMNFLYCILSIVLALFHSVTIMPLGWIYIVLELLVLALIIIVEFKLSKRLARTKS